MGTKERLIKELRKDGFPVFLYNTEAENNLIETEYRDFLSIKKTVKTFKDNFFSYYRNLSERI